MSELKVNPRRKYLRPEKLPHFFCSGCGCGQVLNYYMQALEKLKKELQSSQMKTLYLTEVSQAAERKAA